MDYAEAIQYLNGLSRFGWRLGLDRMEALCDRLGHPERGFDSIHVAGTNGKGSTATFLAGILQAAGFLTGLYTSPHLYSGRERVRIDGQEISEEGVAELITDLRPHIEAVTAQAGPVTEFEAWTMAMFLHFQRRGVKTAVIEAGLGGRWDSTNVVRPLLSLLTNVSLDHMDRLGNTLGEIARDKAGIIKPGGAVLAGPMPPEAFVEVVDEAKTVGGRLYVLDSGRETVPGAALAGRFSWASAGMGMIRLRKPDGTEANVPYAGPGYQARNAAMAAAAAALLEEGGLDLSTDAVRAGLSVGVPGRFQIIWPAPEVILDGAHNPAAAAVLAAELAQRRAAGPPPASEPGSGPALRLVFGGSSGHDAAGCLRILAPLADEVILTRARNPRSQDPRELAKALEGRPHRIVPDVAAAVETAVRASRPTDRVCVTGSFFVLGEAPRSF